MAAAGDPRFPKWMTAPQPRLNPKGVSTMRKCVVLVPALLVWSLSAARTLADGPCGGACVEAPCTCDKVVLRAEVNERKYTVEVPGKPGYTTVSKTVDREVPCTRCVPVCVTDPHTGCTHTEYRTETVLQKVKTTMIEVVPVCKPTTEVRTESCVHLYIEHVPVPVTPAPFCGH
jgi:hypothetical protein